MNQQLKFRRIDWSAEDYASFGSKPQISRHPYNQLPMFDNEALADLLDKYPREGVLAHLSGDDPIKNTDWKAVNVPRELSGLDILRAVAIGKLWINVIHLEKRHSDYVQLIEGLYAQLGQNCSHLKDDQQYPQAPAGSVGQPLHSAQAGC